MIPIKIKDQDYHVVTPDGDSISISEYFETAHYKRILEEIQSKVVVEPVPVLIGELTKAFGIKGYSIAEIGHPVFELGDRYLITIYTDKNEPHVVGFYKPELEPYIKRMP